MICVIALIVFGVIGIFSASHRKLAKEALDCVFRKATLRKCRTNLDERIRSEISGYLITKNEKAAGFVYRNFQLLSWSFTLLLLLSIGYTAYGGYNYYRYGNCYGPVEQGFCIFDPSGKNSQYAGIKSSYNGPTVFPSIEKDDPQIGEEGYPVEIIEFGCYKCPYTKKAEPIVKQILEEYKGKIRFTFRNFPVYQTHAFSNETAIAADCAMEQGKYWEYHEKLFENIEKTNSSDYLLEIAQELEIDIGQFRQCYNSKKYLGEVKNDFEDGVKAGVYGTPTFFINNKTIVGPQDISKFRKLIDKELKKKNQNGNS